MSSDGGADTLLVGNDTHMISYRYGGEEFVSLVYGGASDFRNIAERIRTTIKEKDIQGSHITVSVGISPLSMWNMPIMSVWLTGRTRRCTKRNAMGRIRFASSGKTCRWQIDSIVRCGNQREVAGRACLYEQVIHRGYCLCGQRRNIIPSIRRKIRRMGIDRHCGIFHNNGKRSFTYNGNLS